MRVCGGPLSPSMSADAREGGGRPRPLSGGGFPDHLGITAALLLATFLAAPAAAQERVHVALTPLQPTVGDRIEALLTLRVRGELAGEPRFPAWRKSWGAAEVLEAEAPRRIDAAAGETVYRQRLVLAAFQPGRVPLPPVAVAVPLDDRTVEARTPEELALEVRSVLPPRREGEAEPEPKPATPPRPLPTGERFWWTAAALTAACLAAGFLLWRRRRPVAEAVPEEPALEPLDELLGALDRLDRLAREESAVRLHTGLSLALRRYLGRTLCFRATESTTSEIQRHLLSRRLPHPMVRRAVELLRACDLVKFARQEVLPERSRERLAGARAIAGDLEIYLRPPEMVTGERLEKAG